MAEHQGPRRRAVCKIVVDGNEVTSRLNPYLISVQVMDGVEGGHSECHIELDDRNAELEIPPDAVKMTVSLGWAGEGPRVPDQGRTSIDTATKKERGIVIKEKFMAESVLQEMPWGGPGMREIFSGNVSSCESGFGRRGGGRRLWIEATSGNVKGLVKEPQTGSWGEGQPTDGPTKGAYGAGGGGAGGAGDGKPALIPLSQVMAEIFGKAGLKVKLSPQMMKIALDYWRINESPQAFGQRLARDFGGIFKIENGIASLTGRFEGVNGDGTAMPTVDADWGVNLIGWRIKPYAGRPQWGAAATRRFDLHTGKWEVLLASIAGGGFYGGTEAIAHAIMPVASVAEAQQKNTGTATVSMANRGTGWVLINGDPIAKCGGYVHIHNARPGVDGKYLITEAEHNYTRGVGYTTRMNVQYPTPDYGPKDGWWNDPGRFVFDPDNPPQNHTDPNQPDYTPPPEPKKGERQYTEEEKQKFRDWYKAHQKPYPNWLIPASAYKKQT